MQWELPDPVPGGTQLDFTLDFGGLLAGENRGPAYNPFIYLLSYRTTAAHAVQVWLEDPTNPNRRVILFDDGQDHTSFTFTCGRKARFTVDVLPSREPFLLRITSTGKTADGFITVGWDWARE